MRGKMGSEVSEGVKMCLLSHHALLHSSRGTITELQQKQANPDSMGNTDQRKGNRKERFLVPKKKGRSVPRSSKNGIRVLVTEKSRSDRQCLSLCSPLHPDSHPAPQASLGRETHLLSHSNTSGNNDASLYLFITDRSIVSPFDNNNRRAGTFTDSPTAGD